MCIEHTLLYIKTTDSIKMYTTRTHNLLTSVPGGPKELNGIPVQTSVFNSLIKKLCIEFPGSKIVEKADMEVWQWPVEAKAENDQEEVENGYEAAQDSERWVEQQVALQSLNHE